VGGNELSGSFAALVEEVKSDANSAVCTQHCAPLSYLAVKIRDLKFKNLQAGHIGVLGTDSGIVEHS